jgi:hypothetical protein
VTGSFVAAAIFYAIGTALQRLTGVRHRLLAGIGATCSLLFVGGAAHVPLAVALIAIVIVAAIVLAMRKGEPRERLEYPVVPTVLAAIPALWLLAVSAILPLDDYDGRSFWMLKAKAIAHERSVDGPFFHEQTTVSPRNEYPLLVPIAAAIAMTAGGELDDFQARWLYVLFAIAFALVLREELAAMATPEIGAWCAALFLWLPQILIEQDGGALSAYSDIALGAFAAAAFGELLREVSPLRFGMWTSFALLTKSEGLPLAACLLLAGAFVFRRRVAIALLPVAASGGALFLWRSRLQQSDVPDFARVIFRVPEQWARFRGSLAALASQTIALHDWAFFGIACALAVVLLAVRREWRILGLSAIVLAPMLLLYAGVWAVTDWSVDMLANNVAPRMLTHLLGPFFALFAAGLRTATRKP